MITDNWQSYGPDKKAKTQTAAMAKKKHHTTNIFCV
jgi:hypothetical protein